MAVVIGAILTLLQSTCTSQVYLPTLLFVTNVPSLKGSAVFYLVLYNLVYIVPLSVIVAIFTVTLGRKKLTEWQGRVLKLLSGTMMLGLGAVLLFNPSLLNNVLVSLALLASALIVSSVIILVSKRREYANNART